MFKVNSKDTGTTPGVVLVSLLLTLNISRKQLTMLNFHYFCKRNSLIHAWQGLKYTSDGSGHTYHTWNVSSTSRNCLPIELNVQLNFWVMIYIGDFHLSSAWKADRLSICSFVYLKPATCQICRYHQKLSWKLLIFFFFSSYFSHFPLKSYLSFLWKSQ